MLESPAGMDVPGLDGRVDRVLYPHGTRLGRGSSFLLVCGVGFHPMGALAEKSLDGETSSSFCGYLYGLELARTVGVGKSAIQYHVRDRYEHHLVDSSDLYIYKFVERGI